MYGTGRAPSRRNGGKKRASLVAVRVGTKLASQPQPPLLALLISTPGSGSGDMDRAELAIRCTSCQAAAATRGEIIPHSGKKMGCGRIVRPPRKRNSIDHQWWCMAFRVISNKLFLPAASRIALLPREDGHTIPYACKQVSPSALTPSFPSTWGGKVQRPSKIHAFRCTLCRRRTLVPLP